MLYTLLEVHGEEYKLRLATQETIELERKLGCNPVKVLVDCFTVIDNSASDEVNSANLMGCLSIEKITLILHYALKKYQHGITLEKTYSIYDDMMADNYSINDVILLLVSLFQNSGLLPKAKEIEEEKN